MAACLFAPVRASHVGVRGLAARSRVALAHGRSTWSPYLDAVGAGVAPGGTGQKSYNTWAEHLGLEAFADVDVVIRPLPRTLPV